MLLLSNILLFIIRKATELNKNILDSSNIIREAINNINSHKSLFFLVSVLSIDR